MQYLRKAWSWMKRHWKWLVGGIVLFFTVLTALLLSRKKPVNPPTVLEGERRVAFLGGEISQLEAQEAEIKAQESNLASDIKKLDDTAVVVDSSIVKARDSVDGMTSEEKLQRFKELGY